MAKFAGFTVSDLFNAKNDDHARNLSATLNALGGRDAKAIFGKDVNLDRLKITQWSPDTCGCVVDYIWSLDDPEDSRQHFAHRIVKLCQQHAKLGNDHDAHFAELLAHNRHKNRAIGAAAELAGVAVGEVAWSFDDDGTLAIAHPKVTPAMVKKVASLDELKGRKVRAA